MRSSSISLALNNESILLCEYASPSKDMQLLLGWNLAAILYQQYCKKIFLEEGVKSNFNWKCRGFRLFYIGRTEVMELEFGQDIGVNTGRQ